MTPPVKPEQGGWWDDFVEGLIRPLEGPNPGGLKWLEDEVTDYGSKVGRNLHRDFVEPMKTAAGRLQWLQDWTAPGPGEMGAVVGAVGKRGAVKKALEELRAAAVRDEKGRIYTGAAHPMAYMDAEDAGAVFKGHPDDEGFIHPTKGYITRRKAKEMGYFAKAEKDIKQTVQVEQGKEIVDELPDDIDAQIAAIQAKHSGSPQPKSPTVAKKPKAKAKAGVVPEGTPNEVIRKIADEYNARTGLPAIRRFDPVKHDESLSREVADWYETAKDAPDDAEVKAAYEAFNKETEAQYDELVRQGWEFTPTGDAVLDAYPGAAEMRFDASNKKLKVFTGGEPNKLMTPEQNFKFRAVHDVMAHTSEGYDFHPDGEWNAALKHSQMYSPQAQRALFTETVGQNANLNYGPNGEFNRANPGKEIFPQQKATLLPKDFADRLTRLVQGEKIEAPAVHTREDVYTPNRRGVFNFDPEGGVPATEYREPAPLPFESEPRPKAGPSDLAQKIAGSKKVEKRIIADMEKGLPLGGLGWYGTLPLRRYFEALGKPEAFADFNNAGGAGSIRTPTHNELTNLSLLRWARKRGVPYEEARQEFFRRFPGTMKPTFMGIHGKVYDRALEAGAMVPSSPTAGELKVPHYTHDRNLGAEGVPLDTHELRMMSQALGIDEDLVKNAAVDAESYNLMTAPYRRIAKRFGLHPDQVQAGRWIGGGKQTGLKSQPTGDFMQTLEDGLLFTARTRGLDESPKGLRSLWESIAAGDDFFMPFGGEGGFPVR